MTKKRKDQNQTTKAGAVELEENELNDVSGGAIDTFLKLKGIDGEALDDRSSATGGDLSQIAGDGSYKISTTGKTFTR